MEYNSTSEKYLYTFNCLSLLAQKPLVGNQQFGILSDVNSCLFQNRDGQFRRQLLFVMILGWKESHYVKMVNSKFLADFAIVQLGWYLCVATTWLMEMASRSRRIWMVLSWCCLKTLKKLRFWIVSLIAGLLQKGPGKLTRGETNLIL